MDGRPVILACCRPAWHQRLAREVAIALQAELCGHERSAEMLRTARSLLCRGHSISLVIHELRDAGEISLLRTWLPEVPLLVIASRDDIEDRLLAAAAGADAFLVPPVSVSEILAVSAHLLRTDAEPRVHRAATAPPDWD